MVKLPFDTSKASFKTLPAGTILHRVHKDIYASNGFNDSAAGNARFSPIHNSAGVIPTMYAATTFEGALMETIFHDVPYAPGFKPVDIAKLEGQLHAILITRQELNMVDLGTKALKKAGVAHKDLIQSEKCDYDYSRGIAEQIHREVISAQGLYWTSRQDDDAKAAVFFADRIPAGVIDLNGYPEYLNNGEPFDAVTDLVEKIGALLVVGKL